ncbi:unnamed protein product, partial [Porites evermanni]
QQEPTCERYWNETEPTKYGHVNVSLLSSCVMTNWTVREFIIWSTDSESSEKRDIFQYHFTSWPDHSVPRDTSAFLMFHHKLRSALAVDPGPIVVHCSAGVGRTGAFIAIDSLMEQMEAEKVVDVFGFTARMRKQRNYMVQTQEQYWFIYDVLRDASVCGTTTISSNDLGSGLLCVSGEEPEVAEQRSAEFKVYSDPSLFRVSLLLSGHGHTMSCARISKLTLGKNLQVYSTDLPIFMDALVRENTTKNRSPEILPFNHNRVHLTTIPGEPGSDYINASFIDSYNEGRLYLATQAPVSSTVDDFWRMVWEQRSTIVVMLSDLTDNEMEHDTRYWPEEGWSKYGRLRVTKIDEERLEDHTQRVFKLRRQGQQLHKVQLGREHHGPIIIHCRYEQYNFCYELIKSYLAWKTINTIQNDYV